jgi:hypothetical protein
MLALYRFFTKIDDKHGEAVRRAGASLHLVYWKGQSELRYPKSSLLGKQKAYVPHSLQSAEGIDIGEANFTELIGDDQITIAYNFIAVQLPVDTGTHLLIDSRHNNLLDRSILDTANAKSGLEELVLEGTFPQDYQVYQTPGDQIRTLQLLNPLAMAQLVDTFPAYDIELIDDFVYLYYLGNNGLTDTSEVSQRLEEGRHMKQFMAQHLPR